MDVHVDGLVAGAACRRPGGTAVVEASGASITWADLEQRVATAAGWLLAQGLERGDRVVLVLPNGIAFVLAFYAALRAGAVVVPANPGYTAPELAHLIADSGARLVVADASTQASGHAAAETPSGVATAVVTRLGEGAALPPGGAGGPGAGGPGAGEADAVIAYTSGTTGRPKGARLTHANLLANLEAFGNLPRLRLEAGDVLLGILPFSHTFGLNVTLNAAAEAAATVLALPTFSPGPTAEAMAARGVTVAYGAPPVYGALNALAERTGVRLGALRAAVSGADSLPLAVWRLFRERFGIEIMEGYGLTEAAPVVTTNCASPETRAGTVGHPLPGVRVRVVDAGRDCRAGEEGEVLVAGPNVFAGYHGLEGATGEILRDGWLNTGDLGRFDADGFLSIAGRLKDLIIVSGFNVYPREVEHVLSGHPAVAECAVVGAADERTGERVRAYVVLRPGASATADDLGAHCRARLARFKLPREFHLVAGLPRTAIGKVRRAELRRRR